LDVSAGFLSIVVAEVHVFVSNQNSSEGSLGELGNALAGQQSISSAVVNFTNSSVNHNLGAASHAEVWSSLAENSNSVWIMLVFDDSDLSLDGRVEWDLVDHVAFLGLKVKVVLAVNSLFLEELDDSLLSSVSSNSLNLVDISRAVEKASLLDESESLTLRQFVYF